MCTIIYLIYNALLAATSFLSPPLSNPELVKTLDMQERSQAQSITVWGPALRLSCTAQHLQSM
jgi:hypothetical protein